MNKTLLVIICFSVALLQPEDLEINVYTPQDYGSGSTGFLYSRDSSCLWLNPALLAGQQVPVLSYSHLFYVLDVFADTISASFPLPRQGAAAAGLQLISVPYAAVPDQFTSPRKEYDFFLLSSAAGALTFNNYLQAGLTLNFACRKLSAGKKIKIVSADIGLNITTPKKISFPVVIQGIGYNSAAGIKAGISFPFRLDNKAFLINLGSCYNFSLDYLSVRNGYQYKFYFDQNKILLITAGIESAFKERPFVFSSGLAYAYKKLKLTLDLRIDLNLRSSWLVGIVYRGSRPQRAGHIE